MEQQLVPAGGGPQPFDPRYAAIFGAETEDLYQPTWDRANYAAAGQFEVSFFAVPQGQSATLIRAAAAASVVKTVRDTNLQQAGILSTKSIDVRGISVHLIPLQHAIAGAATPRIGDDKAILYEGGFLELKVADKQRLQLPLVLFKQLDPDFSSTTATTTTIMSAAGVGAGIYGLGDDAIVIPANVGFTVRMQFDGNPPIGQTFDIVTMLHGWQRRPKQ